MVETLLRKGLQVLNLEDDEADFELIRAHLAQDCVECSMTRVEKREDFVAALKTYRFDLILSDYALPSFDGLSALDIAREECPETPFIFVSGQIGEEFAIETLKRGATDYILKDRLAKLPVAVKRALKEAEDRANRKKAEEALKRSHEELERRVTERTAELQRVNKALEESEERLLISQQIAHVGTWDWDIVGNWVIWSDETYRIFGFRPQAFLPTHERFLERIHPEDRERVETVIKGSLDMKTPFAVEHRIVRHNGSEGFVEERGVVYRNMAGQAIRIVGVLHDVTERQKLEEERQKVQRLESMGILAGGIAHDFNNLLQVIVGNISLAKMAFEPEDATFESLEAAERACESAEELSNRLLTFSKGGFPVKKTVSMSRLLKDSVIFSMRGSNISPRFIIPEDISAVEVDEGQMNQVISNLVVNAREAMPEGGVLTISAKDVAVAEGEREKLPLKEGNYVRISFEDSGRGITEDDLTRIFDPYFSTKEMGAEKGRGLGLAICHSIIKRHGGLITVESRLGFGTTFHVYLPASRKQMVEEERTEEKRFVREVTKGGMSARILLMDDEERVRAVAGAMLNYIGCEVWFAEDGDEAVKIYGGAREDGRVIHAVILDLTVAGGRGGEDAMRKLLEIDPRVKGIVSSGYTDDPVMLNYRQYGFAGSIPKPYRMQQLWEALHAVIGKD
ncbi:MAG TPA: response regulator [Thermodesulfovibrionales bacterium]|nr:response regulator [Thermodesulfovibrionales bacterium]